MVSFSPPRPGYPARSATWRSELFERAQTSAGRCRGLCQRSFRSSRVRELFLPARMWRPVSDVKASYSAWTGNHRICSNVLAKRFLHPSAAFLIASDWHGPNPGIGKFAAGRAGVAAVDCYPARSCKVSQRPYVHSDRIVFGSESVINSRETGRRGYETNTTAVDVSGVTDRGAAR